MSPDDAVLRSVTALHQFLAGSDSLGDTLTKVSTLTCEALGADMAGLLLVDADGRPGTPIYTDTMVPGIDQAQYDADRGPCLEARRTQQVLRVQSTDGDDRWPEFNAAAAEHGIHSTLSLPLVSDGGSIGALNLYSREQAHFDEDSERLGGVMAAQAAIAVVNATAYWEMANLSDQLSQAMASRAVIEQAKGVVMATMGCSAEAAFEVLRQQSQAQNQKLRDIAEEIVRRQER